MTLSSEQIATLSRLLDVALELEPSQREGWLASLTSEEQSLAESLREMLANEDKLAADPRFAELPSMSQPEEVATQGEGVGPYRLLHEIGRGGMGSVWLAERSDGSFKRQVALKLPRLAWGAGLAERMAREREIGALLEHPAIGRMYDAGVDERGRPYLAFEYIDGQPIDAWCESQALSLRQRLILFLQVIKAVAYAHGRLVVHRDLKPSNVLVTPDGQAHLLDFGIAKLLQDASQADANQAGANLTQEHGRVLTPHYASPEQIAGEPITVASDVYSLGVLLYELLTGVLPVAPRRDSLAAIEEAVLAGDIALASTRVKDKATARALRGELDAILTKAMQRDPQRRYATADALAQDLQRHLQGETVSARPDSLGYRLRKGLRRHWVAVSVSTAFLITVLSASTVALAQAHRAARSAERERVVKEFVADMFRINTQGTDLSGMRTLSADAFIDRSAQLVKARFDGQPALQADMYGVVGGVFSDMGATQLASEYASRRLDALRAAGADPQDQTRASIELAIRMLLEVRLEDAGKQAQRALELAGSNTTLQIEAKVVKARVLVARYDFNGAKPLLQDIEDQVARAGGQPATALAWVQGLRAKIMTLSMRRDEAKPLFDAAIARALEIEGQLSSVAVALRIAAADSWASTTSADKADAYFNPAIAALRARGGDHGTQAVIECARFATKRFGAFRQIKAREALAAIAKARAEIEMGGRVVPEEVRLRLDTWEADVLLGWGDIESASAIADRSIPALLKITQSPRERLSRIRAYGGLLSYTGRYELADRWLREATKLGTEVFGKTHPYAAGNYASVAINLAMMSRYDEALAFLDAAPHFEAVRDEGLSNADRYNDVIRITRSGVLVLSGKGKEALAAFPMNSISHDSHDTSGASGEEEGLTLYGEVLCAAGRPVEGLRALRAGLAMVEKGDSYEFEPDSERTRAVAAYYALKLGDRKQALIWARHVRAAVKAQPHASAYFLAPLLKVEAALGIRGQKDLQGGLASKK